MPMRKTVVGKAKLVNKKQAEDMVKKARQRRDSQLNQTEEEKEDERSGSGSRKD